MKQPRYNYFITLMDMIFILFYCFFSLFAVLFIQINVRNEQTQKIEHKAEYFIKVNWPYENDDDIDTYIQDPLENIVYFNILQNGLMSLDRDDQGSHNESFNLGNDLIEARYNEEIVALRGIIPGEYILNVHAYNKRSKEQTPITVEIIKLNPLIKTVMLKTVILSTRGEELTVCRFTLNKDGEISDINDLPKYFTQKVEEREEDIYNEPYQP